MTRILSAETQNIVDQVVRTKLLRSRTNRAITERQACDAISELYDRLDRIEAERSSGKRRGEAFSFTKAIRGMCARAHAPITPETAEADAQYVQRALTTGQTPGSYLVPTIQADAIVQQLSLESPARAAGATIWEMKDTQFMNVPIGISAGSWVWMAQNSRQTPVDLNLGQMSFDLKECWSFQLLPAQLFKTALPTFDALVELFFAIGLAEAESSAIFATSTLSGAPPALLSSSGITTINTGGSANGGNISYADITGMLEKASVAKLKFPWVFFCSPRTWTRLLSLGDTTSRPFLVPDAVEGGSGWKLFGIPLWLTNEILNTQSLGSGANQSSLVLCNPRNIHVAQDSGISMMLSTDFALDVAEIALRIGARRSFDYQPRAAFNVLLGIN